MKRSTNEKAAIILAVSVILSVTACSAEGVAYVDGNQSGTGFPPHPPQQAVQYMRKARFLPPSALQPPPQQQKQKKQPLFRQPLLQLLPYRQDRSHQRKQFLTSTYAKFIKSCKNRIKQFLHSRNSEVTLKLNCPTAKVSSKQKGVPNFQQR